MSKKALRLKETAKSVLIVLLSLSALALALRVFSYSGIRLPGALDPLLSNTPVSAPETVVSADMTRPVRMAVVNETGRYGVQYDTAAVDSLFDALGVLLGEALDSAQEPYTTTRASWERALERPGVYFDFPGQVSLAQLTDWLGTGERGAPLSHRATRLLLAQDPAGQTVSLYYVNAEDGLYYACDTSVLLLGRLDEYVPNSALFAFQQPERYGQLDPDTLLLTSPPSPPIYRGSPALDFNQAEVRNALFDALEFSPQSNAVYPVAGGWSIRDGGDTLRLSTNGAVTYQAGEEEPRYVSFSPLSTEAAAELTGELVRRAVLPYCGEARVYLSELSGTAENCIIAYSYALSGAQVQLDQQGWCAQFVVQNGQITQFTLNLRRYDVTEERAALLPEHQAMAVMEQLDAEGRALLLRYYDGGSGTVAPSWIAR